jgi:branched-chain amino acid transport system ATP-binding protein
MTMPAVHREVSRGDAEALLKVEQLEVVYNHVQLAVQGLSIKVRPGEIVAILGTNGAGKTTTLRAITGFLPGDNAEITDGSVIFEGADIVGRPPHVLAKQGIVLVPERDKVFTTLTVEENFEVVPRLRGTEEMQRALPLVQELFPALADRRKQIAGFLSGGERQMLAIARALLLAPRVLLVDELSFGLAPRLVETLMDSLRLINERDGVAILLVEQNAAAALKVAHYAYVLEQGRVVFDGTPALVQQQEDIREFYLGGSDGGDAGFRNLKQYKRRRRWWGG